MKRREEGINRFRERRHGKGRKKNNKGMNERPEGVENKGKRHSFNLTEQNMDSAYKEVEKTVNEKDDVTTLGIACVIFSCYTVCHGKGQVCKAAPRCNVTLP
jgi:hypothetical protein